jgi:prepilin-type N-terminal cleavage/methylation domain-containing protein
MRRGDEGVTLVELLVCLVIMGVVVSALTMSFAASTRAIDQSSLRMADTHDSQMASTLFSSDVQSSNWVWTAAPPNPFVPCGSGDSPVITFAWIGSNAGVEQTNVAAYWTIDQDGEHQLVRQVCTGSGVPVGGTPTSSVVIAHNLYGPTTVKCFGSGNIALPSCDGQGKGVIAAQLSATAQSGIGDVSGFPYVLQATRRPTPSPSTPPSTPTFVQANADSVCSHPGKCPNGAQISVPFTKPNGAGDLLVAYVVWDNTDQVHVTDSQGVPYPSVSASVGWSLGASALGASAQVFYLNNARGGANTITASFDTPVTNFGLLYIVEYSGIDNATNPVDVSVFQNGGGTGPTDTVINSGTVTTKNANDLLVGLGASHGTVNTAGTGYTPRLMSPDPRAFGNVVEDQNVSATGPYAATASADIAGRFGTGWVMQIVAFKADPGGPPL